MLNKQEWGIFPISHLCELGRGRVISQGEIFHNPGVFPVYSSQSKNNGEMGRIDSFDFDGEYVTWTTDGAYAGTVFYRNGRFNCTNVCGTLKSRGLVDMKYLSYSLGSISKRYVSYVGNPKLMNNVVSEIEVYIPTNIKEQQKIAEILGKIDQAIENSEKIIRKQERIKTGLMQDLLTKGIDEHGNIRNESTHKFKDSELGRIPEEWTIQELGKTSYIKGRIGWQGLRSDEFIEEGPYLVTGTDFDDGEVKWNNCYHIGMMRFQEAPSIHLKENDLLITKDGTIGKIALIKNCPGLAILNSGIFLLRPLKDAYNPKFFFYILNSSLFLEFLENNKAGSTIKHLYQHIFQKFNYFLPSPTEQNEIVKILEKQEDLIKIEQDNLRKMQKIKTGLMQDLLSGKVRTTHLID